MAYDFPADVLDLRRTLDHADADLARLHGEYHDRPDDELYRARVGELRAQARRSAVALCGHPWLANADGGPAKAREALQKAVAEEMAAPAAG